MVRDFVYLVMDYFLKPRKTIEKISLDPTNIEKLGIIGAITTFISVLLTYSKINIGMIMGITYIILLTMYTIFVIGVTLSIGKKPVIEVPKVFWFFLSIGIIDNLLIIVFPISILVKPLFSITIFLVLAIKIYYLIVGTSILFKVSKSTALLIVISPYVIIGILGIFALISSYTTITEMLEWIEL